MRPIRRLHKTAGIGAVFGPVMVGWFAILAVVGLVNIFAAPAILAALNPLQGVAFCLHHGWTAFVALGAEALALTGAEALYADMGHFGPTRFASRGSARNVILRVRAIGCAFYADPVLRFQQRDRYRFFWREHGLVVMLQYVVRDNTLRRMLPTDIEVARCLQKPILAATTDAASRLSLAVQVALVPSTRYVSEAERKSKR
jgi:hypothetical protein